MAIKKQKVTPKQDIVAEEAPAVEAAAPVVEAAPKPKAAKAAATYTIKVTSPRGLNVRKAPSAGAAVSKVLECGETAKAKGDEGNYYALANGGYVMKQFCQVVE